MGLADLPLPAKVEAEFGYTVNKQEQKLILDSKVFPPCTNKIEEVGRLKKRSFLVHCDGNGYMTFTEMRDPIKTLKDLAKLYNEGVITEEEFEQKKRYLLDRI